VRNQISKDRDLLGGRLSGTVMNESPWNCGTVIGCDEFDDDCACVSSVNVNKQKHSLLP